VCCGGGAHGFVGHDVDVEPLEGGPIQVRGEEFDPLSREGLSQQCDLPASGRRGEAVEVEEIQIRNGSTESATRLLDLTSSTLGLRFDSHRQR